MAKAARTFGYLATIAAAGAMVAPILWMVSTSLKPESDVLSASPRWIPKHLSFEHFTDLLAKSQEFPVLRWLFNSVVIACAVTVLVLFVTSMAAFALARLTFVGRDSVFLTILGSMMVPGQVLLIPLFLIVAKMGLFNTYLGVILPGVASAFGVFMLRQFFVTIPRELEEAAFLDGANLWTIYSRIVVPLGKPALATLSIFTFMASWNSFEWPLIVTNDVSMRTLPVGLSIFQGQYVLQYGITMASALLTTIPMLIAFLIFQRRITDGIAYTGSK